MGQGPVASDANTGGDWRPEGCTCRNLTTAEAYMVATRDGRHYFYNKNCPIHGYHVIENTPQTDAPQGE